MTPETFLNEFKHLTNAPGGVAHLRDVMLDLAVRGRLAHRDPADEPVAALLDRVPPMEPSRNQQKWLAPPAKDIPFSVPSHWAWLHLGSQAVVERGGSPRPIKSYLTDSPDGLNWIKIADTANDSRYITGTREKIRPEGLKKTRMVFPGDFLLTNSMSFGRPYISKIEGCIHDGWLRIRLSGAFDQDYVYWLLSSPYVRGAFKTAASGAVVQNLNASKVRSLLIPLPPLAEQKRIVAKVDELMALCDDLEAQQTESRRVQRNLCQSALQRLGDANNPTERARNWTFVHNAFPDLLARPENIRELRKTILQLAVTGHLVPQNPNDEASNILLTRIATERRNEGSTHSRRRRKARTDMLIESGPYPVPAGWNWTRFANIASVASNLVSPTNYPDAAHVAPNNIERDTGRLLSCATIKDDNVRSNNHMFYEGQILYSKIRPALNKAVIAPCDGLCSADMYPIDCFIDSGFLLRYILSPEV